MDTQADRRTEGGDTVECTKVNCPMQAGTPTDNCGEKCPWRTTAKTGDLISRAAAIEALGERPHNWTDSDSEIAEVCAWESHKNAIENVPAVDAVPVVHGRWTERHVDYASDCAIDEVQTARCSVCGLYHTTPYLYYFKDYKFCPNCWAKMDGEQLEAVKWE